MDIDDRAEAVSESKGMSRQDADACFVKDVKADLDKLIRDAGSLVFSAGLGLGGFVVAAETDDSILSLLMNGIAACWCAKAICYGTEVYTNRKGIYRQLQQYLQDPAAYFQDD